MELEDFNMHVVGLTTSKKNGLCSFFHVTPRRLNQMISKLVAKHVIIRMNSDELVLNPSFFYKGSPKDVMKRIENFYLLYNDKYGTNLSYLDDFHTAVEGVDKIMNSH